MSSTNIKILTFFLLFLAISCGDNPTNNTIINTGTISFKVSGNLNYNFDTKNVIISLPDSSTNFLTVYASQNDSKGSISFIIRILVNNKDSLNYNIINDNSISVSFNNGAEAYKSVNGTLNIINWNNNTFKATFNAKLEHINNKETIILIDNGEINILS